MSIRFVGYVCSSNCLFTVPLSVFMFLSLSACLFLYLFLFLFLYLSLSPSVRLFVMQLAAGKVQNRQTSFFRN